MNGLFDYFHLMWLHDLPHSYPKVPNEYLNLNEAMLELFKPISFLARNSIHLFKIIRQPEKRRNSLNIQFYK